MPDPRDLEASLADMHRKLRELKDELARLSEAPDSAPEPANDPALSAEAQALEDATARRTAKADKPSKETDPAPAADAAEETA